MDLPLTQMQEQKLVELARHAGKNVGELLVETASSLLASEEKRWADVEHALGQAERGELIEEDEMDRRVARMLAR
jgi:predicted transcriptional regulator